MPARTVVHREALEVERRDPRRRHAGGVHPAHRPGRSPRHRRRGARRGALAAGHDPTRGRRAGLDAHLSAALLVPAVVQHGGQPGPPGRARDRPRAARASFAQFQADRAVVGLARQLRKAEEALDGLRGGATCDLGDFMEYAALRRRISATAKARWPGRRTADRRARRSESLARLGRRRDRGAGRPVRRAAPWCSTPALRRRGGPAAVRAHRRPAGAPARRWSTSRRRWRRWCRLRIPKTFNGRNPQMRRDLASALRTRTPRPGPAVRRRRRPRTRGAPPRTTAELSPGAARRSCRRTRATAAPSARTTPAGRSAGSSSTATPKTLRRRVEQRTNTIARQFDRVCEVLDRARLPRRRHGDAARASGCAAIYSELDLVAAECLRDGALGRASPARAGRVRCRCWSSSRAGPTTRPRRGCRAAGVREVIGEMVRLWAELDALEREHRLDFLREPDLGLRLGGVPLGARATSSTTCSTAAELAAGDFVRWMKQLLDLPEQVADAAGDAPLRGTAREVVAARCAAAWSPTPPSSRPDRDPTNRRPQPTELPPAGPESADSVRSAQRVIAASVSLTTRRAARARAWRRRRAPSGRRSSTRPRVAAASVGSVSSYVGERDVRATATTAGRRPGSPGRRAAWPASRRQVRRRVVGGGQDARPASPNAVEQPRGRLLADARPRRAARRSGRRAAPRSRRTRGRGRRTSRATAASSTTRACRRRGRCRAPAPGARRRRAGTGRGRR